MLAAQLAQRLQEFRPRRDQIHVAGNRFDDHRGNLRTVLGKRRREAGAVVVVENHGVLGDIRRHSRRTRIAEGQHPRAGLDQQAVRMAMIATLELNQQVAAGVAARQPNGAHRRLGPGTDQANHFQRRQQLAQQVRHVDLAFGRCAEGESLERRFLHRGDHLRVGVAENQRPPGTDIIDVALAVGVGDVGTGTGNEKARRAADRTEGAHRRVDAAGNVLLGALKELLILGDHEHFPRRVVDRRRRARRCRAPRRDR